MIGTAMYTTIITLYKQKKSRREISSITSISRNTVNKIISRYKSDNVESPMKQKRGSYLDEWHEQIVDLLGQKLSNVRIKEKLQDLGCKVSYPTLSAYIKKHKVRQDTCIRFHTPAGEEAQVDFGYVGRQPDSTGKLRKAYVFNMKLSHSRLDYYEIVYDQTVKTWISCHINAFNYFGCCPEVVKLDNLKAGILKPDFYEPLYQKEYKRFGDHYGVLLSPCRPYKPQEKGKVESGIKYVKNNFFAGRNFDNNASMNIQLRAWLEDANQRVHGTTRQKPKDLFLQEEQKAMKSLPTEDFCTQLSSMRKVQKDCHVVFEYNHYSVPSQYVSLDVRIAASNNTVKIYHEDEVIATHARAKGEGIFTTNILHYDKSKRHCPGFPDADNKYKKQMEEIGVNACAMLKEIMQRRKKDWYRPVKGIIKLCQLYDKEIVDMSCKRAMSYGLYSYSKVKSIIESNCYDLPLPEGGEDDIVS